MAKKRATVAAKRMAKWRKRAEQIRRGKFLAEARDLDRQFRAKMRDDRA